MTAMKQHFYLRNLLQAKFEEIRLKNPQFSRRAFGKRLQLSAGAISELLNGRRKVSPALLKKISDRLMLDPEERSKLLTEGPKSPELQRDEVDSEYLRLSTDQFHIIGDWYHFAILTLMRTKDFKSSNEWIAKRLGLPVATVRVAIERLQRLEMVKEDKNGKLTRTKVRYRTTDDVANISVRKAHHQYLDNAKKALESVSVEKRDYTSLMMAIDPVDLPKAKVIIRKFHDELSLLMKDGKGPEVFQLLISFFPLTDSKPEHGELK